MRESTESTAQGAAEPVHVLAALLRRRYQPHIALPSLPRAATLMATLDLAARFGVAGALADGVRRGGPPAGEWASLLPLFADLEARTQRRNRELLSIAETVTRVLAADGIAAVLLKGAAFVAACPQAAPWRDMCDLDVLVAADQAERAERLLLESGFRPAGNPAYYGSNVHHHRVPLTHPGRCATVEIHERLLQAKRCTLLATETIIAQSRPFAGPNGATLSIPRREHRIIHAVAHCQINNWGHALAAVDFKPLLDMAELHREERLDWDLIGRAFAGRTERRALGSLVALVGEVLGPFERLPGRILEADRRWSEEALLALTHQPKRSRTIARIARQYLSSLLINPARGALIVRSMFDGDRRRGLMRANRNRLRPVAGSSPTAQ